MKKFILKTGLFLLPCVVLFLFFNERYKNSDEWKRQNNVYKFNFVPENIQLANVGSSHGEMHFKYDIQDKYVAFNFGLAGQQYFYDYNLLKKYINNFAPDSVLVILVSYFYITQIPPKKDFDYYRARYYRILPPYLMEGWKFYDYLKYSVFPILKNDFLNVHFGTDDSQLLNFFSWRTKTDLTDEELNDYCIKKHEGVTNPEAKKGEEGFVYNKIMVSKIIDLCKSYNIKPVLVTAPVTDCLNGYFEKDEGFFETFYRFTDEICSEYPGVQYFDYSHDKEFSSHKELFQDGDHLNVYGAEAFTRRIISDLENAGLLW